MSNTVTGTSALQETIGRLTPHEETNVVPYPVVRALGTRIKIDYLGLGREITDGDATFGVFARGVIGEPDAWIKEELHFSFVGPANSEQVRQAVGHLAVYLRRDGQVIASVHSFDRQEGEPIAAETLTAPLGAWATATVVHDMAETQRARDLGNSPPIEPIALEAGDLKGINAFLADDANRPTYFRFDYDSTTGRATGIRVAPTDPTV